MKSKKKDIQPIKPNGLKKPAESEQGSLFVPAESVHKVDEAELTPIGASSAAVDAEAAEYQRLDAAVDSAAKGLGAASDTRDAATVARDSAVENTISELNQMWAFLSERGPNHDLSKMAGFPSWEEYLDSFLKRPEIRESKRTIQRRLAEFRTPPSDRKPAAPRIQIKQPELRKVLEAGKASVKFLLALGSGGNSQGAYEAAAKASIPLSRLEQLLASGTAGPSDSGAEPQPGIQEPQTSEDADATMNIGGSKSSARLQIATPLNATWDAEQFADQFAKQYSQDNPDQPPAVLDAGLLEAFALMAEKLGTTLGTVVGSLKPSDPEQASRTDMQPADHAPAFEAESGPEGYAGSVRSWPERPSSTPAPAIKVGDWSACAKRIAEGYGDVINSVLCGLSPKAAAGFVQKLLDTLTKQFLTPRFGADVIRVKVQYSPVEPQLQNGQVLERERER